MKKILLGTTALIGAGLLAGSALAAEAPKVTVGGFADFQFGWVDEDLDAGTRDHGFRNDTEINFNIDGKTEGGLGYGAVIDLEADVDGEASPFGSDNDRQGINASRTYVYLEGAWGRVQLGSAEGAEETLRVDASTIARATGGINGDWRYFTSTFAPFTGVAFIAKPQLPLAHGLTGSLGDKATNNNNKITYYTPRFYGFQAGVSYSPDFTDRGQTVSRLDSNFGSGDNVAGGISYNGQWDKISLAASATGEMGNSEVAGLEDLRAWNVGAKVGFMGFNVAASYGDWSDSLNTAGSDDSNYWTVGGAYEWGAFGASVTYLSSSLDVGGGATNDFDNLSVGVDWKLAEGLTPYAEVSFFDESPAGGPDNNGTVFLLGTLVSF